MDPQLFRAATEGSVELIEPFLESPNILAQVTPIQDTIIHIAAKLGHLEFVKHVKSRVPAGLFTQANSKGDTPFHVAARAGHSEMISVLVTCVTDHGRDVELGTATETAYHEALRMTNVIGDTAMHDAVRNLRLKVVKLLIQLDPQLLRQDNSKTGESPLHAAVEKGELAIVKEIINAGAAQYSYKGPNGRTALHAAIIHKRKDIAELLLEKHSQLAAEADDNNRSPMHFATTVRSFRLIELLLKYDTAAPSSLDKTGVAPIHIAALYGEIRMIKKFRELCPNLETLPDKKHRNLLHYAIEGKEISLVKYILSQKGDFEEALNEKDEDGNTPLHQATLSCQPHVVNLLVNDKRIDRMALNKQGLSASAIAVSQCEGEQSSKPGEVLVLATLLHAERPTKKWFKFIKSRKEIMRYVMRRKMSIDRYKSKANNLMVIATLVATVTFAAGFTMPGGYNSNDEHHNDDKKNQKGIAVLLYQPEFKDFVMHDARALYSSTLAVIFLIGVQLIDSVLPAALMFYFARSLTMLALLFQLLAFEYGVRITTLTEDYYVLTELTTFGDCALIMIVIGLFLSFLHPLFPFLYCSEFYVRFRCWLNQTRVGTNQPRNWYKQCKEDVAALLSYKDAKSE